LQKGQGLVLIWFGFTNESDRANGGGQNEKRLGGLEKLLNLRRAFYRKMKAGEMVGSKKPEGTRLRQ